MSRYPVGHCQRCGRKYVVHPEFRNVCHLGYPAGNYFAAEICGGPIVADGDGETVELSDPKPAPDRHLGATEK